MIATGFISKLVALALGRPRLTLLLAVLAVGMGFAGLSRARIDSSLTGMLGAGNPAAYALARTAEHFHTAEAILLLVSAPAETDAAQARPLVIAFAQRFERVAASDPAARALIDAIRYKPDATFERYFREIVIPAGPTYLGLEEFGAFLHRLSPGQVREQMEHNEAMLAAPGPQAGSLARELVKDPLRLRDFVAAHTGAVDLQHAEPTLSDDGRALLIRVSGRRPVNDLEFSKELTRRVQALVNAAEPGPLEVRIGGGYAIAAASATAIRSDAISSTAISLSLLLAFFTIAYRGPVAALQIALAAGSGIIVAFGFYTALAGALTPLTAVLASMLAGLGVDYAIHFRAHHAALTLRGVPSLDASMETTRHLSGPMLGALATTVVGFGAVALGEVKMLRDFALLGCLGLLGSFVGVHLILPCLLLYSRPHPQMSLTYRAVRWYVGAIARDSKIPVTAAMMVFIASVAMIAATPGFAPPFEADTAVLHPQPNAALETGQRVQERFHAAGDRLLVHVQADSVATLVERCHELRRILASSQARQAGVRSTRSIADLLPDPRLAAANIEAMQRLDVRAILDSIRSEIEQSEFQTDAFDDYLAFLESLLTVEQPPDLGSVVDYPEIAELFLPREAVANLRTDVRESIMYVELTAAASSLAGTSDVIPVLRSLLAPVPGATLTGISVVSQDLQRATRRDLATFGGVSVLLVVGGLVVLYRRLADVLLALLPVLFSMCFVAGVMSAFGVRLNVVNITAAPLLVGIAVDCGIFLVSAARQSRAGRSELADMLVPTLHAILCTAITTGIGFGTLVWTRTPAVQSLGLVSLLGVLAAATGAFALLAPLLLCFRPAAREDLT